MAGTYDPIASQTITSDQSYVTFSSIPTTYTDLIIVKTGLQNTTANLGLRVGNGSADTGTNYSGTQMYGSGTSAASDRFSTDTRWYMNYSGPASTGVTSIATILNYSNTTTYKTMLVRNTDAGVYASAYVFLWRSTAAINYLEFSLVTSGIKAGSTFALYGVKAA